MLLPRHESGFTQDSYGYHTPLPAQQRRFTVVIRLTFKLVGAKCLAVAEGFKANIHLITEYFNLTQNL